MAKPLKNTELDSIDVSSKEIEEAREKLGESTKDMTDEQIKDQITCIKYLTENWLDEYEKSVFDGKTLREKFSDL